MLTNARNIEITHGLIEDWKDIYREILARVLHNEKLKGVCIGFFVGMIFTVFLLAYLDTNMKYRAASFMSDPWYFR
jgi:hypothetical protein